MDLERYDMLVGPIPLDRLSDVEAGIAEVIGATCVVLSAAAAPGRYLGVTFGKRKASCEGLTGFVRGILWSEEGRHADA